ncbi:MAG: mechanosensitive ion channel family protein [Candidatus Woesearchaeota archaeon]|jgi:MscS family membrane protein|nr:mechanosensitive ion channel family protein [Candidatus Woesearchaeota archaeon]|tara:strand:- start:720 stop:1793 length:1074 start_codon:yes stop_codon:yes gene_type:complete
MEILGKVIDFTSMTSSEIWANPYAQALLIFVGFFFIAKIVVFVSEKYLLKLAEKTKTQVDDMIIKKTNRPISLLLIFFGVKLGLLPLGIAENIMKWVMLSINSLIFFVIAYIFIVIFDVLINYWAKGWAAKTKSRIDEQLLSLFHRFSRIVVLILVVLFILQLWGVQVGPLFASLGIAGLAIAFALQSTLGNIFGGVSMIIDGTLKKGDIVKLESGESGAIYDIGIRSTRIKTWDNELITIPNGKMADSKIQNLSQPDPSIRINIEFGVEYGSNPEEVKKLVVDLVKKIKPVMQDPEPKIWFTEMGDFALKFKLMFWVDDLSLKWPAHQEAMTKIYDALNKAKIGIPFPTRTVYNKR